MRGGVRNGVGFKWFGKIAVALVGREAWERQDSSLTWTDGGAVSGILSKAQAEIERVVSENATLAVADYASDAKAALRTDPQTGEVIVGLLISNSEASQIVEIPLRQLISAALVELRPQLGVDAQAQAALSGLIALAKNLSALEPRQTLPQINGNSHAPAATQTPPALAEAARAQRGRIAQPAQR